MFLLGFWFSWDSSERNMPLLLGLHPCIAHPYCHPWPLFHVSGGCHVTSTLANYSYPSIVASVTATASFPREMYVTPSPWQTPSVRGHQRNIPVSQELLSCFQRPIPPPKSSPYLWRIDIHIWRSMADQCSSWIGRYMICDPGVRSSSQLIQKCSYNYGRNLGT